MKTNVLQRIHMTLRAKCSCKDKEYPLTEVFSFLSLERNWREISFFALCTSGDLRACAKDLIHNPPFQVQYILW